MTQAPVLLITGGAGYVARHLIHQAMGWQVHATFHHQPPTSDLADWHPLDMRDSSAVLALVAEVRPAAILHAACQMNTPAG